MYASSQWNDVALFERKISKNGKNARDSPIDNLVEIKFIVVEEYSWFFGGSFGFSCD
jgi:hypothetical protein